MNELSSFWSRRKAAVQAEADAEALTTQDAQTAETLDGKTDEEVLEHFGLPDPASLQAGDDFSGFMARGVPEHLLKIALRALWRSNPVLANLDGLNEYDEDYRAAMLLSEPIKTAYQVGKGMKAHIDEMARKAAAAEEALEPSEDDAPVAAISEGKQSGAPDALGYDAAERAESKTASLEDEEPSDIPEAPVADSEIPTPRHMRFRFEEASA